MDLLRRQAARRDDKASVAAETGIETLLDGSGIGEDDGALVAQDVVAPPRGDPVPRLVLTDA